MTSIQDLAQRIKRGPTDVVGLDIAVSGVKAVRMKKSGDGVAVVAADILPVVALPSAGSAVVPLKLPAKLTAKYASIALPGHGARIKLLSFPGHFDATGADRVTDGMGLEDPAAFRIGYRVISEGHGRSESRVLAVAYPDGDVAAACQLLPAGVPAPWSVEVSGLASLTSFLNGPAVAHPEEAIGAIDFGARVSMFALVNRQQLVLVRKFDFGAESIVERVQESLGVDRETAQGILQDGSFDISQAVGDVLDPFCKQFVISRDFVERRENCRLTAIYSCGGMVFSRDWLNAIHTSVGVEVKPWNPFEAAGVTVAAGAIPENLVGQEARLAAAMGAGMATLEGE